MKKSLLALVIFAAFATLGAYAQESRGAAVEQWRCFSSKDIFQANVLITLTRILADGKDRGIGDVKVAGVVYKAKFQISGFNRRWNFGKESVYAFVITPDGSGAYYDFSNSKENVLPSQKFHCVSP